MNRAVIHGTGLIGASVGGALRQTGWHVAGWDPDPSAASAARDLGFLDEISPDPNWVADLVVLAGPPSAVLEAVRSMPDGPLVIDVAGTKADIEAAGSLHPRFVATHPMAGREHGGAEHASVSLFVGATWVVVTDHAEPAALAQVESIIESMGANPLRMTAEEHDRAVASVSHLPQIVAAALLSQAADDEHALHLAAGSFRDLTRVALSSPELWTELLVANRRAASAAAAGLADALREFAEHIEHADTHWLSESLVNARTGRAGLAPPVVAIQVVLEDQPGEIARVGRALEVSRADVRDLQLRHARHGGGGVLTLSVRPGEAEPLRSALERQGFELAE